MAFEMHEDLSSIANVLVKAILNHLGERNPNLHSFRLVVPNFTLFKDLSNNLLTDLSSADMHVNDS